MNSRKRLFVLLAIVVIAGAGFWMYRSRNVSANVSDKDLLTVQRVDFPVIVYASGVLEAIQSVDIGPPRLNRPQGQFRLMRIVDEGIEVDEGDFLMEFDTSSISNNLVSQTANFQRIQEDRQQRRGNSDISLKNLRLQVEKARSDLEKNEEQLSAQAGLACGIEVELMRINLEASRTNLEMLDKKLEYATESDQLQIQMLRNEERVRRSQMDDLMDAMDLYTVRAPVSGVVVYRRDWNNNAKEIGSNVSMQEIVMSIPDLSTMRARVQVDELDSGKIALGQDVSITVDSVQGRSFAGKVTNIGTILKQASYDRPQKIMEIYVDLTNMDVKTLRPGMSLRTQIRVGQHPQAVVIPMGSIEGRDGRSFVQVYNDQTKRVDWREVRLRANDGQNAVVESGVDAGERIRIRPQL
jgi:HlyD family secretion protein